MKKVLCALLAVILGCGVLFTGCNREDPNAEEIDPNRTQIYVGVYEGGLGSEWIKAADEAFEAKYSEYQVIVDPGKSNFDGEMVYNNFDTYRQDIFFLDFVDDSLYRKYIKAGYIADIGEAMTQPLTEYGETESVYDKITPFLQGYYKPEGTTSMYALPWYQASYQIIYDKALFEEEWLYKDPNGEWNDGSNKSVGQDGVEGTYDDGLPVTDEEFFELMDYMLDIGITPMTWTGKAEYYFTSMLLNMFAKYEGYDDFVSNYSLSGNDSDIGEVTLDNGYRLRSEQSGKRFALEFTDRLIRTKGGSQGRLNYFSGKTFASTQDNVAAQNEYLYSATTNSKVAMLVEGSWWEKESKGTFDIMDQQYSTDDKSYAYGEREFGVMPLPLDEGMEFTGNTVACVSGRSMVFVNNHSSVKEGAELFLQFLHSDEMLSKSTALSNVLRPYDYEMKNEDLAAMTPYGRELAEYYSSSQVVFDSIPLHDFLINEGSEYVGYLKMFSASIGGVSYINPAMQFNTNRDLTVDSWLNGLAISATDWAAKVAEYRA